MNTPSKSERILALLSFVLFTLLILWGNLVAGVGAGLGCPDWPLCHGRVVPEFHSYEVFFEYTHRVLALLATLSLTGLCILRFRRVQGGERTLTLIPLLALVLQIVLGGVVVLLELPPGLTILHFALALLIYSFVFLFLRFPELPPLRPLPLFIFVLFFLQAVLGALVRHHKAGLACPDWPTCLGAWVPHSPDPRVLLHLLHRYTGYGIFLFLLILWLLSFRKETLKPYRFFFFQLFLGVVLQVGLGVGIIHTHLNPWIIMLHALIALGFLALSLAMLRVSRVDTPPGRSS